MKKYFLPLLALLQATSAFAVGGLSETDHVTSIKVYRTHNAVDPNHPNQNNPDDLIGFQKCSPDCTQLGGRAMYKVDDIKKQRTIEMENVGFSVAGDAAIVAGVAIFNGILVSGCITEFSAAGTNALVIGSGAATEGGLADFTYKLNPYRQYEKYRILKDDVLNGDSVQIGNIEQAVMDLELVLSKVDAKLSSQN